MLKERFWYILNDCYLFKKLLFIRPFLRKEVFAIKQFIQIAYVNVVNNNFEVAVVEDANTNWYILDDLLFIKKPFIIRSFPRK